MTRALFSCLVIVWCTLVQPSAVYAGTVGGGSDGPSACAGLGYLGPAVGVKADCQGRNPVEPNPGPGGNHGSRIDTGPNGYYWAPGSGDSLSYVNCPGGEAPEYVQEYNPQGQPVGPAQEWCPGQPLPPPGPPAPPPSPEEVWGDTPLPTATIGFSPASVGLTQLATWLWAQGVGGPVEVTKQIDGYNITTEAQPISYVWRFGDGTSATVSTAGGPEGPAAQHTYTEAGTYDVSVQIDYAGSFGYVSPLGTVGTQSLPVYDAEPVVARYTVQQVRSVLVPTAGG
jgi:PKD domain